MLLYLEEKSRWLWLFQKNTIKNVRNKRMFVSPEVRGMGLAQTILLELAWAHDLDILFSVLKLIQKKDCFISKNRIYHS
jgi:hypothetical protein